MGPKDTGGHRRGCLVCGEDLEYLMEPRIVACSYCGQPSSTDVVCKKGHFVCDACHRAPAEEIIQRYCEATTEPDPIAIAKTLMGTPQVKMHGPEHHFMVPAVLLAAFYNVKGMRDEKLRKIGQARQRAELVKGGFCGTHGDCGAAVGTGIFVSLVTGATPLSKEEWKLSNLVTARSLETIALHGGPRCCKRNAFLAILTAVEFSREHFGVVMPVETPVICRFSPNNKECLAKECPFFSGNG